jgi:hypothetical protein
VGLAVVAPCLEEGLAQLRRPVHLALVCSHRPLLGTQDIPASDSDSRRMSYLRVAGLRVGRGNHCSRARTTTDLEEAAAFGL